MRLAVHQLPARPKGIILCSIRKIIGHFIFPVFSVDAEARSYLFLYGREIPNFTRRIKNPRVIDDSVVRQWDSSIICIGKSGASIVDGVRQSMGPRAVIMIGLQSSPEELDFPIRQIERGHAAHPDIWQVGSPPLRAYRTRLLTHVHENHICHGIIRGVPFVGGGQSSDKNGTSHKLGL